MKHQSQIHVVARGVILDQDHILLCKTLDRPINYYFLPGGHVEHGESAEEAVKRELLEESGAECRVKRFLGCLEYSFDPHERTVCHNHEYNFVFELESDTLKLHKEISQMEDHIQCLWMPISSLPRIDFRRKPFKTLIPKWLQHPERMVLESVME